MVKPRRLLISLAILIAIYIFNPIEGHAADVVNPKQTYSYDFMVRDIRALAQRYPDIIQYKTIGNSEYGRPIYAVSLGTGNANVFFNGSHHAREWITTNLNMYMLEQYAKMYEGNQVFGGYNVRNVLDAATIWFVPMVNPDGVTLQQFGLSKFPKSAHSSLIKMNEGSTNFKRWKANAKGVDLNRQYAADWKNIKNNTPTPSWSNHKGYKPEQSAETKAIVKFTKEINPEMAVAYHTSGELLYWNFHQSGQIYTRDHTYAKKMGQLTGYRLFYPGPNPSGGGYTDWFVLTYKRPAFTPEVGTYAGNTNVPTTQFDRIWNQNKLVGLYTASESYKLYLAKGGQPKAEKINLKIDDQDVSFNQSALLINKNAFIPASEVFEYYGAIVEKEAGNKIIVRKGTTLAELQIGSQTMKVNGTTTTLNVAPQIYSGNMMVPLQAVSEVVGTQVEWDEATLTVTITSPPMVKDEQAPALPVVDPVTDVTQVVTGKSETNAMIVVQNGSRVLGQARVNLGGAFSIQIPAQKADQVLTISATDLAGNMSEQTQVKVSYTSTFTDSIGHWAQDSIGLLKDRNITEGMADGSFGVNKNITRGESAALIIKALQLEIENNPNPNFVDVKVSDTFYKYIAAIVKEGIMIGKTDSQFKPGDTLTRAEMAKILVNAFDLESNGNNKAFSDVKTNYWAYDSIRTLASLDITGGYPDRTFKPGQPIKRAEFAALLAKTIKLQE
jgi:murein tripeptide amidase MpaA